MYQKCVLALPPPIVKCARLRFYGLLRKRQMTPVIGVHEASNYKYIKHLSGVEGAVKMLSNWLPPYLPLIQLGRNAAAKPVSD
jgi:hypothetical protein